MKRCKFVFIFFFFHFYPIGVVCSSIKAACTWTTIEKKGRRRRRFTFFFLYSRYIVSLHWWVFDNKLTFYSDEESYFQRLHCRVGKKNKRFPFMKVIWKKRSINVSHGGKIVFFTLMVPIYVSCCLFLFMSCLQYFWQKKLSFFYYFLPFCFFLLKFHVAWYNF